MDKETRDAIGKALLENARLPRNHASYFNWKDKEVKELNISSYLANHMIGKGIVVTGITLGEDPPDVVFETENGKIGVELVELVDNQAIQDQINKRTEYLERPEWTRERFVSEVNHLLNKKDNPSKSMPGKYKEYVCLIHSDEPDLIGQSRDCIISKCGIIKTNLISQAYLVTSYDPQKDEYPIYQLI